MIDYNLNSFVEKNRMICLRANRQENILRANRQEIMFKGKSSREFFQGQIVKRLYLRANCQEIIFKGKSSKEYFQGQIVKRICFKGKSFRKNFYEKLPKNTLNLIVIEFREFQKSLKD